MSDSFFGFEADTPVLGVGGGVDDGLDEFDDEIDLMNDQTFGAAATTEDWENEHEKLTADDSPIVRGQNGNHKSNSPRHDLEASLRQLVVDDEDDGTAVHRGCAIPTRSSHLSELFGPSSPSGLYDTEELIRGHENIWGSPVRDSPMSRGPPQMRTPNMPPNMPQHFLQQHGEEGLKGLLHQMHQTFPSPPQSNAPKSLYERNLMRQEPSPPNPARKNSRAMTLEELERELTGDQGTPPVHILRRPTSPSSNLPLPIGTPPQQQHFPPSNQPLPGFSPRVPPPGWSGPPPPMNKHSSPSMPPGLSGRVDSPNNFRPHHDQYPSPPSPESSPAIVSLLLSAARHFFPSRHASLSPTSLNAADLKALSAELLRNQKISQTNRAGRWPSDAKETRGSPPFHRPPPGHEHFRGQHHQNDIRQQFFNKPPIRQPGFNQGPPPHRGRGPMDPRGGMNRGLMRGRGGHFGPYQHRPHFQQHDDYYRNEDYREERNGDPYANLMTEREKDWVIKIQLRQLQTDNPYLDDYYYTSMQMKKEAAKRRGRQIDAKLVIPQIAAKMDKDYKPLTFEGSLGRLTTSSVHNPRRIIDVSGNSTHEIDEAKGREVRRFKKLLLDIEASYDTLLDVDELEKRALALPEEARTAVYEERSHKILHMYQAFHELIMDEEAYCRLLAVRKGVKVIARLLPLLPKDNGVLLASSLLAHLSLISKKEWQKDVLPVVCENMAVLIQCCDLDGLVKLSGALSEDKTSDSPIAGALQNQFGSSVVWCLVSRGESLYTDVSPVDMEIELQNAWSKFVQSVTEAVEVLSKDLLAKPSGMPYSGIGRHLERLVDKRAVLSVEDKLQSLLADGSQQQTAA
ncbi:hypothetical protein CAPTEDRAFT_225516 [Capitella teleta]|uniref:mRNA decay factor PAT1 domain-containing protein n=1 Tax=Capitella teleta TaxID=283909 RepID=R7T9B8_CAPTE|nr:hypothetical protein CAPTEDRAFT_225516 [Capitella teleta]|eukprot:ELT88005.1 hypothetical protein CAPTEDRAFT_225516 [Capitella teleta]